MNYDVWCEVKKVNIVVILLGVIFLIGDYFLGESVDYCILILTTLLVLQLIKNVLRYVRLKEKGTLVENVPYSLKVASLGSGGLELDLALSDGKTVKLYKNLKNWNGIPEQGVTNVLICMDKPKIYYVFDPKIEC